MTLKLLTEKYANVLDGVLSCYDRIVIQGSIQPFCYAQGMTGYLYAHTVRIFNYPRWAEPLGDQIRAQAEAVTAQVASTADLATVEAQQTAGGTRPVSPTPPLKYAIQIKVADTGPGLRPEDCERIFEPFVQLEASHLAHSEGAGLGLTLARRQAEALGGRLWAESEGPGLGSRFILELPVQ